jgi:hypothetical protein
MKCAACGRQFDYKNDNKNDWRLFPTGDMYKPWVTDIGGEIIGVCPRCIIRAGFPEDDNGYVDSALVADVAEIKKNLSKLVDAVMMMTANELLLASAVKDVEKKINAHIEETTGECIAGGD